MIFLSTPPHHQALFFRFLLGAIPPPNLAELQLGNCLLILFDSYKTGNACRLTSFDYRALPATRDRVLEGTSTNEVHPTEQ